ncbi:MAG TPA: ABC transporter ATP-binding protein [Actinomycetota bacterium]|nr:ABC transporter ATP-binding protein [Actinomycetota bacterium]
MAVIEVRGLKKDYRRLRGGSTRAVDGLDLTIEPGGVFGLLGPNGSGKTTTFRCILGLARPTEGECRLLGADSQRGLHTVVGRVGSIVEAPALFPTFSGKRNLELLAAIHDIPDARVGSVLERVGLAGREKHLVRTYSLGMRQRLAIAAALLKDPELLILDEPANGLDPAGIREVREMVRSLAAEGRTVVVSSHILSEVQLMCDRVAILSRGRCVAVGDVEELLRQAQGSGVLVRLDDPSRGAEVLRAAGLEATESERGLHIAVPPDQGSRVARVLAEAGLYPNELRPDEVDLETVFLDLTEGPASS